MILCLGADPKIIHERKPELTLPEVKRQIKELKSFCDNTAIIKGDSRVAEISAASILAKVERDAQMLVLHEQYPEYGFDKHKGYPTKVHREILKEIGPCPEHRRSYAPVREALA